MIIKKLWRKIQKTNKRNTYTTGRREFLVERIDYNGSIYMFLKSYMRDNKIISKSEMKELINTAKNIMIGWKIKLINLVNYE